MIVTAKVGKGEEREREGTSHAANDHDLNLDTN